MATQFSHNSFLYFKYIIRKGNGTFVSSANLKLQSFFILIPGSPKLPGPPKTFSFILYTYHSQNQRAKRTAKPFRPLIFLFFPFLFFCARPLETTTTFCASSGQPQTCCRQDEQSCKKPSLPYISHLRKTHPPVSVRPQIQPAPCRPAKKADTRQEFFQCGAPAEFPAQGFWDFRVRNHRVFFLVFAVPAALVLAYPGSGFSGSGVSGPDGSGSGFFGLSR